MQILCQIYVIFSYSEDYIFILLMVSFNEHMVLLLMKSTFPIMVSIFCVLFTYLCLL